MVFCLFRPHDYRNRQPSRTRVAYCKMATLHLHNNHNVYILGAGFSVDAGLPTIANFLQVLRQAGDYYRNRNDEENVAAIEWVLDYRLRAAGAAYRCTIDPDNIEDLFSLIDIEEGPKQASKSAHLIRQAIAATIEFARLGYVRNSQPVALSVQNTTDARCAKFGEPAHDGDSTDLRIIPLYDAYLAALTGMLYEPVAGRRDTIITFNYDTLVESALDGLERPYHYGFLPDEYVNEEDIGAGGFVAIDTTNRPPYLVRDYKDGVVQVLKLHGSVNWGLRDVQAPNSHLKAYGEKAVAQLFIGASFDDIRHDIDRVFIEPPTWRKGYGTEGRGIATVWNAALEALRIASRIIVIGYSLPTTDVHFRYLLSAGLRENISLQEILFVNPDLAENAPNYQDIESRIFRILRPGLRERKVIRFRGNYLKDELIRGPGLPLEHHKESLFGSVNPNSGNRPPPFVNRVSPL